MILITLAVILATRELASGSDSVFAQRLASYLIVPIASLLILFGLIVASSAAEILP